MPPSRYDASLHRIVGTMQSLALLITMVLLALVAPASGCNCSVSLYDDVNCTSNVTYKATWPYDSGVCFGSECVTACDCVAAGEGKPCKVRS